MKFLQLPVVAALGLGPTALAGRSSHSANLPQKGDAMYCITGWIPMTNPAYTIPNKPRRGPLENCGHARLNTTGFLPEDPR